MRLLIDGYNLLHAVTSVPPRLGPDGLRKLRNRFLNDLAYRLGPIEAAATTVVFDAHEPPEDLPRRTMHKGMTILFAAGQEGADAGIEALIAQHSAPKRLTVVSSDHRIRQAARRRKARVLTADEFWSSLAPRKRAASPAPEPGPTPERAAPLTAAESAYWQERFRDVLESTEARELSRRAEYLPSDEEIARIEREVAEEEDRF
jgi:predicted RNA-binding protein with PIN domain